jgi:putative sterol carrier protein
VAVGRGRRRFADRKAELLRRWVAAAPDARLDSVMRGPLRAVLLWQIFATMRERFDGDRASGVDAVVEFRIRRAVRDTVDRYQVVMAGGRCTTTKHGEQAPTVALEMDSVSFLRLVGGAASAPGLVLRGRLSVRGDFLLAARLPRLLNIPAAPNERS